MKHEVKLKESSQVVQVRVLKKTQVSRAVLGIIPNTNGDHPDVVYHPGLIQIRTCTRGQDKPQTLN